MSKTIFLSSYTIPEGNQYRREGPRPLTLRQSEYNDMFDWKTLFFDAYRVGPHVVFQGPPLFNLLEHLKKYDLFRKALRPIFHNGRYVSQNKRGEIWIRTSENGRGINL